MSISFQLRICEYAPFNLSKFLALKTIVAPIDAQAIATALPIPEEAPVTNMLLFLREKGLLLIFLSPFVLS